MQVKNGLAGFRVRVDHGPIACSINSLIFRNFPDNRQQVSQQSLIVFQVLVQRTDVLAWNDKQVNRSLWIGVLKGQTLFVLVDDLCGFFVRGHLTENTPEHFHHPSLVSIEKQLLDSKGKHFKYPQVETA